MLNLSLITAVLVVLLMETAGLFITVSIKYIYKKTIKSISWFVAFYILVIVTGALMFVQARTNSSMVIYIRDIVHLIAIIHLLIGMFRLHNEKPQLKAAFVIAPIGLLLAAYFTFINLQPAIHAAVLSFSIGSITFITIFFTKPQALSNDRNISSLRIIVGLIGFFHMIRATYFITQFQSVDPYTLNDSISIILVSLVGLSYFAVSIGILMQINTNLFYESMEHESTKASLLENIQGFAFQATADDDMTLLYVSKGFTSITGFNSVDFIHTTVDKYKSIILPKYRAQIIEDIQKAIETESEYEAEYQIETKHGEIRWLLERGHTINKGVDQTYYEGLVIDITERKLLEQNLEYLSYRDVLTGVGNRRAMHDRLNELDRVEYYPIAIIMADLNGLKFVNDSFGHDYGDIMIKQSATILTRVLENDEDVFRIGGDEFIILMHNTSAIEVEQTIKSLNNYVDDVFGLETGLSISFGYAVKESTEVPIHDIFREAENFMYQAKLTARPNSRKKAFEAVLHSLYEKDPLGKAHANQVSKFSKLLAEKLGLPLEVVNKIETAGLLHDVGKVVIDTSILAKTGTFTEDEFAIMREHPAYGYRILSSVPDLGDIPDIILEHHERPDGLGYPKGLKNKEIRIEAKIICIADAFSAMTLKDYYKPTRTIKDAVNEIQKNSGTQFDQELTTVFIREVVPTLLFHGKAD